MGRVRPRVSGEGVAGHHGARGVDELVVHRCTGGAQVFYRVPGASHIVRAPEVPDRAALIVDDGVVREVDVVPHEVESIARMRYAVVVVKLEGVSCDDDVASVVFTRMMRELEYLPSASPEGIAGDEHVVGQFEAEVVAERAV